MGLSYRVASAALLIIAIVLIKRHLDHVQDESYVRPFWQFSSPSLPEASSQASPAPPARHEFVPEQPVVPDSFTPHGASAANAAGVRQNQNKNEGHGVNGRRPSSWKPREKGAGRPDSKPGGNRKVLNKKPLYETTPIIVPNDRVIVMARMSHEDTSWVRNELANWRNVIYTVDNPHASKHTPKNKGRESLAYLQYIVEHYHSLPTTIVFVHSHKDGWPEAWHTDTMSYSNVESIRALQLDYVQRSGYVNLRCQGIPGCPDEIQPFRDPARPGQNAETLYAEAWKELFNNTNVPQVVAVPCCSQFAVSRDQVLKRPKSDYDRFYRWVLNTPLPDDMIARIMEYTWHIIFGQNPVYCPDALQCYQDVYGSAYFF